MINSALLFWSVYLLPFLFRVPVLDYTLPGSVIRVTTVAFALVFAVMRLRVALKNITANMYVFLAYMCIAGAISMVSGLFYGRYAEPGQIAKFYFLQGCIFLIAMSFDDRRNIEKIFRYYYYLCVAAASQAIIAIAADYVGIRQLGEIAIDRGDADYRYMLSWYGLLGGDVWNGRTNFYFSESTHFAHFLFPGIAYAIGNKRPAGLVVLLGGFFTTFAAFASLALLGYLLIWYLLYGKLKDNLLLLFMLAVLAVAGYFYVTSDESLFIRLFSREHSIDDKSNTYATAYSELMAHPFGVGLFNASEYYGETVNTSGGIFGWIVWFGWLSIPALLAIFWSLFQCVLKPKNHPLIISMGLGLFFLTLATISHGPLPKYYMILFYGLLFRYRALTPTESVVSLHVSSSRCRKDDLSSVKIGSALGK